MTISKIFDLAALSCNSTFAYTSIKHNDYFFTKYWRNTYAYGHMLVPIQKHVADWILVVNVSKKKKRTYRF